MSSHSHSSHAPVPHTRTSSSSSSSSSISTSSPPGPPGGDLGAFSATTSSSLATLLTSGGIDTRESLFGYLQGLTASPRVTDEEQRERERLYRRLVKRQRRARLHSKGYDNNGSSSTSHAHQQAAEEGDAGHSATHVSRERKRQRTKATSDGLTKERSGCHSLTSAAAAGSEGTVAVDRRQGTFTRPVPSWIPSPVAAQLTSSSSSLQVLNSSSPYGSSSSTTSSPAPSPLPSLYDPYTSPSASGSTGLALLSAAFEPVPIVPRPSGAASYLPPHHHHAQHHPPSLAARHLVGLLSTPSPWDHHDESLHQHQHHQQTYLGHGQHNSRGGLYAPRQEQRSLPATSPLHHRHQHPDLVVVAAAGNNFSSLPAWPRSEEDELSAERYQLQQRHRAAAYPEWLGCASSSPAAAVQSRQTSQEARQRDPVACLEWDCLLEDPPVEAFAECSGGGGFGSVGSSPAPPLFAHEPHPQHYHPQQQQQHPHLQQHQQRQQQQQHYHHAGSRLSPRAALSERTQLSQPTQIAYAGGQMGGERLAEADDGRLSPRGLADLLLLYPDGARLHQAAASATTDLTSTTTQAAALRPSAATTTTTTAAHSGSGAIATEALPSLGVSVPSPLFAWLAGSL